MDPVTALRYHALRLLANRPYPAGELTKKLSLVCMRRKRAKRAVVAAQYALLDCNAVSGDVVSQLVKEGLVDDKYFSDWFVRQRTGGKHRSFAVLKAEMRMKGVDDETISEAMEEQSFSNWDQCKLLAQKKTGKMTRDKLLLFLVRKGFPYQLVQKVVDSLDKEASERGAQQLR